MKRQAGDSSCQGIVRMHCGGDGARRARRPLDAAQGIAPPPPARPLDMRGGGGGGAERELDSAEMVRRWRGDSEEMVRR